MSGIRKPLMINGVPVVAASPELDLVTAEQLRTVLLRSAGHRHPTIVVDMTRTRLCDPAGLNVLIRAHMQALAAGGGLRVVIPAGSRFSAFQVHRPGQAHPPVRQPGRGPDRSGDGAPIQDPAAPESQGRAPPMSRPCHHET
jgi:anti-anti-sigma factor